MAPQAPPMLPLQHQYCLVYLGIIPFVDSDIGANTEVFALNCKSFSEHHGWFLAHLAVLVLYLEVPQSGLVT